MKKLLLFCLFLTPLIACAAASDNNSPSNLQAARMSFFHGKKALQEGNFDRAKSFFQKSANLGYPAAIEVLANFQQVVAEHNQQLGSRGVGITVERTKK